MLKPVMFAIALTTFVIAPLENSYASGELDQRVADSRAAVKQFFGALKGELVAGIKAGGPANAIGVCNHEAPIIAANVSMSKGMHVGRTSLKLRNPNNKPDAWERAVLEKFSSRKAAGEDPAKMEYFEVVEMSGEKIFRYMKAIPTAAKPCLACHGDNIAAAVDEKLSLLYPDDKAVGYKAGDIRGAFTIMQGMD